MPTEPGGVVSINCIYAVVHAQDFDLSNWEIGEKRLNSFLLAIQYIAKLGHCLFVSRLCSTKTAQPRIHGTLHSDRTSVTSSKVVIRCSIDMGENFYI